MMPGCPGWSWPPRGPDCHPVVAGLVVLLVDGAAHWTADSLAPDAPAVVGLGPLRRLTPVPPVSQTPPALASLLTGCQPSEHGITGRRIPVPTVADPFAWISAFRVRPARDLLWDRLAAEEARIATLDVAWADPGVAVTATDQRRRDGPGPGAPGVATGPIGTWIDIDGRLSVRPSPEGLAARIAGRPAGARPIGEAAWRLGSDDAAVDVVVSTQSGQALIIHSEGFAPGDRSRRTRPVSTAYGRLHRAGAFGPPASVGGSGRSEMLLARALELPVRALRRTAHRGGGWTRRCRRWLRLGHRRDRSRAGRAVAGRRASRGPAREPPGSGCDRVAVACGRRPRRLGARRGAGSRGAGRFRPRRHRHRCSGGAQRVPLGRRPGRSRTRRGRPELLGGRRPPGRRRDRVGQG